MILELGKKFQGQNYYSRQYNSHQKCQPLVQSTRFCQVLPSTWPVRLAIATLADLAGGMAAVCQQHYIIVVALTHQSPTPLLLSNNLQLLQCRGLSSVCIAAVRNICKDLKIILFGSCCNFQCKYWKHSPNQGQSGKQIRLKSEIMLWKCVDK